jgi:hypothetical protein
MTRDQHVLGSALLNRTEKASEAYGSIPTPELNAGPLTMVATAYDRPNAEGQVLGETRGLVRLDRGTLRISTAQAVDAEVEIFPLSSLIGFNSTKDFAAGVRNPDFSYVLLPRDSWRWTSEDGDLLKIDSLTGRATTSGLTGETTVHVYQAGTHLSGRKDVTVQDMEVSVFIYATPQAVTPGAPVMLTWTSTNATSVTDSDGFYTSQVSGSQMVYPLHDTAYGITVHGDEGYAHASVTVVVSPAAGN